jgi:uncharacterized protein (DUF362 family)/NAD-dependent dihydropyrimidine dehydrogenase PreA subunit
VATVALVRCESYDRAEVEDAVGRAVELVGRRERFFPEHSRVLLKPNLLAPRKRETRVTTDPEVVRALAAAAGRFAREVTVGDSPGIGSATRVARASGYTEALEGTGARVVDLGDPVRAQGIGFPSIEIARAAAEADSLVNIAKAKTHAMTGLTLAAKNLFGCVVGTRKAGWHLRAGDDHSKFARVIVEVAAAARAKLHVLDAVIGMEGNGPGSGTPRPMGFLLASEDATALDAIACDILGVPARAVPTLGAARDLGWGEAEAKRIDVAGDDSASFKSAFRRAHLKPAAPLGIHRFIPMPRVLARALRRLMTPRPVFDSALCRECNVCIEVCPAKCLVAKGGRAPAIDREKCIRCFCCQEACPHGAVAARGGWLGRMFR